MPSDPPATPAAGVRTSALVAALALALTACGEGSATQGDGERPVVQAALYPLAWAAERVAGPDAVVETLAPPGTEPHDVELTPRQVGALETASLVLTVPGLQPALDDALGSTDGEQVLDATAVAAEVAGERAPGVPPAPDPGELGLDADLQAALGGDPHEGHAHEGEDPHEGEAGDDGPTDPHLWLDPTALAAVADETAARLAALDPDAAEGYRARAADLRAELEALDGELASGLASCEQRVVVVGHEAFGHLAARYGLRQVGVAGLSPEDEPSARRLDTVSEVVRQLDASTVFTEPGVDPAAAETVAAEAGVATAVLDPVEVAPEDGDYLSAMRGDLDALRTALGCA